MVHFTQYFWMTPLSCQYSCAVLVHHVEGKWFLCSTANRELPWGTLPPPPPFSFVIQWCRKFWQHFSVAMFVFRCVYPTVFSTTCTVCSGAVAFDSLPGLHCMLLLYFTVQKLWITFYSLLLLNFILAWSALKIFSWYLYIARSCWECDNNAFLHARCIAVCRKSTWVTSIAWTISQPIPNAAGLVLKSNAALQSSVAC